ncbi:MAG: T9SS type A sorting domain-containing protein [Chitinophagales bacterium]
MKKLFTLFLGLFAITALFAQSIASHQPRMLRLMPGSQKPHNTIRHEFSSDRGGFLGTCDSFQMDYNQYEELNASNKGLTFHGSIVNGDPLPANELTAFVDTFHSFASTYIKSVFDTIAFVTGSSTLGFIPRASTTLSLDSLGMFVGISGDSTKMGNDTLLFTIYKRVGTVETLVKTINISGASWFEPFYVQSGSLRYAQIPVNYQLNKGEGFAVRMDYLGKDTSSHFFYTYCYTDSCGTITFQGQNYSSPAYTPTFGIISYQGEIQPAGNGAAVSVSNNGFGYNIPGVPQGCRFVYEQIYNFFPIVKVCTDYSAVAQATPAFGCSQSTVTLNATVFGSNSTSLDYTWSATGGTLTSTSGDNTSVVLGNTGDATIYLTVSDGTNLTYDTIKVLNKGIGVTLPSTSSVGCGASTTLVPSFTGNQTGKTYLWSTSATTSTLAVNLAGNYNITVTNNSGCSATASTSVEYSNGTTNTVNFTYPTPVCVGKQVLFTNTSTNKGAGWSATWDMLGNNTDLVVTTDASYTYNNPGQFYVSLTMDSAGCKFSTPFHSHLVNVLAASAPGCVNGIEDAEFTNSVTVVPNPTSGKVMLTINGVEGNVSVKVYNIIGSEVKTYTDNDVASVSTKSLDFTDLANGTYLVKVQTGTKVAVKRITVSK